MEYQSSEYIMKLPKGLRGIYVLYQEVPATQRGGKDCYQVVYVGMVTTGSIRARLRSHRRKKQNLWTHFSAYEVWDNIRDDEIAELEGLFRHLYRRDPIASGLNKQRGFKPIRKVRHRSFEDWLP